MSVLKKYIRESIRYHINEAIDINNVKFKVHNNKTIGFYNNDFKNELGTLDLMGGFETTSDEACETLVKLFGKLNVPVKTEKTHGGSPNIVISKTALMKFLTMIKNRKFGADKIGSVVNEYSNDAEFEKKRSAYKYNQKPQGSREDKIALLKREIEDREKSGWGETPALRNARKVLAGLEKNITEISQSDKTKQLAAIDMQISDLQKKKESLSKQEVTEDVHLQHGTENDKAAKEIKTDLESKFKSEDFTLQKMSDGTLLRYQYWEELPKNMYDKLKQTYDIKMETDHDEDTGRIVMYILNKKK